MQMFPTLLIAALLAAATISTHASPILTIEATGGLDSGADEAGFFGSPDSLLQDKQFIHSIKINLDSCVTQASRTDYSSWGCQMMSSFSILGRTLNSPWAHGQFSTGGHYVAVYFGADIPFDGGVTSVYSFVSTELPWLASLPLNAWESVRDLAILAPTGPYTSAGNASYGYHVQYHDLSRTSYTFTGETGADQIIINPVSEPSTTATLLLALLGLVIASARRRSNSI